MFFSKEECGFSKKEFGKALEKPDRKCHFWKFLQVYRRVFFGAFPSKLVYSRANGSLKFFKVGRPKLGCHNIVTQGTRLAMRGSNQ